MDVWPSTSWSSLLQSAGLISANRISSQARQQRSRPSRNDRNSSAMTQSPLNQASLSVDSAVPKARRPGAGGQAGASGVLHPQLRCADMQQGTSDSIRQSTGAAEVAGSSHDAHQAAGSSRFTDAAEVAGSSHNARHAEGAGSSHVWPGWPRLLNCGRPMREQHVAEKRRTDRLASLWLQPPEILASGELTQSGQVRIECI